MSLESLQTFRGMTQGSYDGRQYVNGAFALGLLWQRVPAYAYSGLQLCSAWEVRQIFGDEEAAKASDRFGSEFYLSTDIAFVFRFTADTSTSWHECYRNFRSHSQRALVKRDGGRISYLLKDHDLTRPEDFQTIWFLLDISLATCERVKVGERMVKEDIYETKCADMLEPIDEDSEATRLVFDPEPFLPAATPEELAAGDEDIPF